MNERIKALMGKTLDSEFSHTWDTMTYEGLLQFSEKFAELIVRQCIDIASQEDFDVMMKEGYPCSQTAKKIREHFGVES